MKRNRHIALVALVCCLCMLLTACTDATTPGTDPGTQPAGPKTLGTPFVSIDDTGLASWAAIPNASGYTYKFADGTEKNTTSLSVQLTDGLSIQVKAVGDGANYADSAYSAAQTYTATGTTPPPAPTTLGTPFISIDSNGVASWGAVANASGYKYKINGGTELIATGLSVQLTNGQSIVVKAVGDGVNYLDGAYSASATYTASVAPTPTTLATPVVSIDTNGLASWTMVPGASAYKYKINGGAELIATTLSIQLTDGQTISVKAVGDGVNYVDSAYSAVETYTAPSVEPGTPTTLSTPVIAIDANGLATWGPIANANGYKYKINGGAEFVATTLSVQLANGQSIQVKAVGDGVNYVDSPFSAAQVYTAPSVNPTTLATPEVTVGATGLATWAAVPNASGYKYKINGGAELVATGLSVQLADGQNIVVKAVGDGVLYTDSAYSATRTYNANPTPAGPAPSYLGIVASGTEPSDQDGLPGAIAPRSAFSLMMLNSSRSFDEALEELFGNSDNHLGATYPAASNYDIYSAAGQTIYIQIWLDNPEQYTILSLKLNGTKYQVGGGLSSFFIEEDGTHYNCVYVAVTIPSNTYVEKSYTVTDIEYIANTYINADGTDEFMNENDTISVGLPYSEARPSVSDHAETDRTSNTYGATFTVSDSLLADAVGGWMGVAVYDGYNIVKNQVVTAGSNEISVSGLAESTWYTYYIYIYGDLHDGRGVAMHHLYYGDFETLSAVRDFTAEAGYYSQLGWEGIQEADSGLAIDVSASLNSATAEFDRLEVYLGNYVADGATPIYTNDEFYGYAQVKDLLARTGYTVRIYYSDVEYTEHYTDRTVQTSYLDAPKMEFKNKNPFVNGAALTFGSFENGYMRTAIGKNVRLVIYKDGISELRYMDEILELLDNPNAYTDVQTQYDTYLNEQNYNAAHALYERLYRLETANRCLTEGDYSATLGTDKAAWQDFFDTNTETLTYADEDMFINGDTTYAIVRDYFAKFGTEYCSYEIYADVNFKDGKGFVKTCLEDGGVSMAPLNSSSNDIFCNFTVDGYTVTVDPYSHIDYKDNELAIISYTIGIYKNDKLVEILKTCDTVNWASYDESAWIDAYVNAMKGEAALPSDPEIIEFLGWQAIFETINGLQIEAEEDYIGGGSGDGTTEDMNNGTVEGGTVTTPDGSTVVTPGGGGVEKNIANLAERDLLRDLLALEYPSSYEYSFKEQMLQHFMYEWESEGIIEGLTTTDEKLEALIANSRNSVIVSVVNSCVGNVRHYMTWTGADTDDIFIGFKNAFETYISENSMESSVNWGEVYRRVIQSKDVTYFYPYGMFETTVVTVDPTKYTAGNYRIGIAYRYETDEAGEYRHRFSETFEISGPMPTPTIGFMENENVIDTPQIEVDFWQYYFEIEYQDAEGTSIYSGKWNDFEYNRYNEEYRPMKGYKVRVRARVNEGVTDTIYQDSAWSEWFVYEGIALTVNFGNGFNYETSSVSWHVNGEAASYIYTLNGGEEIPVSMYQNSLTLKNGDVLRVKAIAAADGAYLDSEWAEFTCVDERASIDPPTNLRLDGKQLAWDAVTNAAEYEIERTAPDGTVTTDRMSDTIAWGIQSGYSYRVRAIPSNYNTYRVSEWSESFSYTEKLDNPEPSSVSASLVRWNYVSNATSYYYKIGATGTEAVAYPSRPSQPRLELSKITLQPGDEIYVQARADGYESSDWVLIYTYTVQLVAPALDQDRLGTVTWNAIANADGYKWRVQGEESFTTITACTLNNLTNGTVIEVCATSSVLGYTDSSWSSITVVVLTKIPAPVISIDANGLATWTYDTSAGGLSFRIEVNGIVVEESTWQRQYQLNYGDTIRVLQISTNTGTHTDSDWSEPATRLDIREKLATPVLSVGDGGVQTALPIDGAVTIIYKLGADGIENELYWSGSAGDLCILGEFDAPSEDTNIYVKLRDNAGVYADSEWAVLDLATV